MKKQPSSNPRQNQLRESEVRLRQQLKTNPNDFRILDDLI
jgi:hypothetical protein